MKSFRKPSLTCVLLTTLILTACSLNEIEDYNNKFETPAQTAAPSPVSDNDNSHKNDITSVVTDKPDDVTLTATPLPTPSPAAEADRPAQGQPAENTTPAPTEDAVSPVPTEVPATPTPTEVPATPTPKPRDVADRDEYRSMTFLIWAPAFEYGVFSDQDSGSTYDYAVFTEVSAADIASYKDALKKAGFTDCITDSPSLYKAANSDGWCVTLEYSDNTLKLGSGFDDSEFGDDGLHVLYSDTMLQYIPEFEYGNFESSETTNDESEYTYAFFSGVTEDEVRSYINELKDAGYVYSEDSGDLDGIIWYMALNEDVFECYVAYDNGIVKIGCGDGD